MPSLILANVAASVSDLKKNPMGTIAAGDGAPVVILNHSEPAFYCVPPAVYEAMLEQIEDAHFNAIADARRDEPVTKVTLDEL